MPSAAAAATASSMRTVPSTTGYSLWRRRWTKTGLLMKDVRAMLEFYSVLSRRTLRRMSRFNTSRRTVGALLIASGVASIPASLSTRLCRWLRERRRLRAQGCGALLVRPERPNGLAGRRRPLPQALKPAQSQFVDVRGMRQHVLTWGDPAAP